MTRTHLLLGAALLGAAACKEPLHLSYDYGRAYVETLRTQADLTRPSVQYQTYSLYGIEAVKIRVNVEEAATDVESDSPAFQGVRGNGQ